MFSRLFARSRSRHRIIADDLYGQIVAAARQPHLYSDFAVPDTPLGRYEMVALHLFLVLHRLRGQGAAAATMGQELTDTFFTDVDHSLRELGIGDMGIPKRMKKLARMYLGRASNYAAALDAGDRSALATALARNIRPDIEAWQQRDAMAAYVVGVDRALSSNSIDDIVAGRLHLAVGEEASA